MEIMDKEDWENVRFLGVPGKQKDKGKKSSKNGKDQKLWHLFLRNV